MEGIIREEAVGRLGETNASGVGKMDIGRENVAGGIPSAMRVARKGI